MKTRKFILANCTEGDQHLIPIDEIKHISPRGEERSLKTKIVLKSDQLLYTTESPRELHVKIIRSQRAK